MWQPTLKLEQIAETGPTRVEIDDEGYVLYRSGETVYCLVDMCSHDDVPLSMGIFDQRTKVATCPQHGARFDVCSGKALSMPAVSPVRSIPTKVEAGMVYLDVDE